MQRTSFPWAALGLLLLATAVYLPGTAHITLWQDEGWSWAASRLPDAQAYERLYAADNHPPLFNLVLNAWRHLAGDRLLVLRRWASGPAF
ncbi:MAG: hypothetical protein HC915_18590 [Anaerolineae bacterium]|nr:hypothetical protein [Anaerolineae bacterium]